MFFTDPLLKFMRIAVEGLSTNLMLADDKMNIVYLNPSVRAFLEAAEQDIKRELPNFSVRDLIGQNIDVFHKNPAHNRGMLDKLRDRHSATIRISGHAFDLNVRALMNGDKKIGYSVEWSDANARLQNIDYAGTMRALDLSQARIEFDATGVILDANRVFLDLMGYKKEDIVGKTHAIFVDDEYRRSPEYGVFWSKLASGETFEGEFKRIKKDGTPAFIQGNYLPIKDDKGVVRKVVKLALDVSDRVDAIAKIGDCLQALAGGDLTRRLGGGLTPALAKIGTDIDRMAESLESAMQLILEKADSMKSDASAILQAADALSKRTEQQAANVEESAAALSLVTASVKSAAQMAAEANQTVLGAKRESEHSGQVVAAAVGAMTEISESARQISQIIGVIDEIAFQTNLLALNAGVEAARAGEAGKGFAVVASEVRSLAQRSAEAAKEIKGLISTSSDQVEKGVDLVGQAGDALKRIAGSVVEISSSMQKISAGASEQATSLSEVNTAVAQMDTVVQQNAAMVEESTASSASLARDADSLYQLTARFNISDTRRAQPSQRKVIQPSPQHAPHPARARGRTASIGNAALAAESSSGDWAEF